MHGTCSWCHGPRAKEGGGEMEGGGMVWSDGGRGQWGSLTWPRCRPFPFISASFMHGHLHSRGSCPGRLSFVRGGRHHLCCRLWLQLLSLGLGHGCCPWGCVVICGLCIIVCGWGSFAGTVRHSWLGGWCPWAVVVVYTWGGGCPGPLMCGVAAVSSWCCHGLSCCCHIALFVWLSCCPVGKVAPVSGCEKRMEEVSTYLPEPTWWWQCVVSTIHTATLVPWPGLGRLLVSSSMCAVRAVGGWWWWWLLAKAVRQQEQLASMVVVVGMERVLFVCWLLTTTTNRASGFADTHFGCR